MALLAGKTAIITGGARGLGSAIATAMASEGARVVVVDRNRDAASELVAQINASGGSATSEILDIGDREAVKAFGLLSHWLAACRCLLSISVGIVRGRNPWRRA